MVPKRSLINSVKTKLPNKPSDSVSNEIKNNYNKQASNYQKQIKQLKKKIIDYKKQVLLLENENDILRNQNKSLSKVAIHKDALKIGVTRKTGKSLSPNLEYKVKGCSCKGNCSNKICGCVKKQRICQKFCKCNVQCKNQEPEKENINTEQTEFSKDSQTILENLGWLTLNPEVLQASDKKTERNSFSLFEDRNEIIKKDWIYPSSPITFETKRRLFTQNSDEMVDIDTNQNMSTTKPNKSSNNFDKFQIQISCTSVSKQTRNTIKLKKDLNKSFRSNKVENFLLVSKVNEVKKKQLIQQSEQNLQQNVETENKEQLHASNILRIVDNEKNNQEDIDLPKEINLNPMVPKYQLQRSPINATGSIIMSTKSKRFSPVNKELAMAEVNWKQHQSQLIMCKICKRKFFPHRIEKHLTSCKGI